MSEAETRVVSLEGGGKGCKLRNAGSHEKLKQARKQILPQNRSEKSSPVNTLLLLILTQ